MRVISFNVNGIRSMATKLKNGEKKGHPQNNVIRSLIEEHKPDILCLQEIKTQSAADIGFRDQFREVYTSVSTIKKGYSGVALLTNMRPEWVEYGFDRYDEEMIGEYQKYEWTDEGRIIVAKFEMFVVVTVYTPNSQAKLARLEERIAWEQVLRMFLVELQNEFGAVILCGDLNCAFQDIDIHNPKGNAKLAGFSKEEREEFGLVLEAGFTDSFRFLHPEMVKYTYWSNFRNARERNMGWRIDYVLVSSMCRELIRSADCLVEYMGSDHCPVLMEIAL